MKSSASKLGLEYKLSVATAVSSVKQKMILHWLTKNWKFSSQCLSDKCFFLGDWFIFLHLVELKFAIIAQLILIAGLQ